MCRTIRPPDRYTPRSTGSSVQWSGVNRGVDRVQGDGRGERGRPGGEEPRTGPPAAGLGGPRGPGCSAVGEDRFHLANHICAGRHARSSAPYRAGLPVSHGRAAARGAFEARRRARHAIVSGNGAARRRQHGMSGIQQVVLSGPLILAVPIAAAAGAITFLSPCCLPLVPGYLAYATGMSGTDAQTAPRPAGNRRRPGRNQRRPAAGLRRGSRRLRRRAAGTDAGAAGAGAGAGAGAAEQRPDPGRGGRPAGRDGAGDAGRDGAAGAGPHDRRDHAVRAGLFRAVRHVRRGLGQPGRPARARPGRRHPGARRASPSCSACCSPGCWTVSRWRAG